MGEPSQAPQEVHAQSIVRACRARGQAYLHSCCHRNAFAARGAESVSAQQVLPLMRVKKLMKEEADVKAVAGDASYAAARATVSVHLHGLQHLLLFNIAYGIVFKLDAT